MRILLTLFMLCAPATTVGADGIAMHGSPALAKDFAHYAYATPKARKTGALREAQIGTFDSLNPFSVRGTPATALRERVFESLLSRHYDEPFALYGLLAESVTTPETRAWVRFTLNSKARFADGRAVTPEDVAFSARKLRAQGRPNHRYYYGKIARIETTKRDITFHFKPENGVYDREMPLIMGLMPILPKHIYSDIDLQRVSLTRPIGSGAYRVAALEVGRRLVLERDPDYWGASLPSQNGRFNFDRLETLYFRDSTSAFEAFKSGLIDIWFETDPQRWKQIRGNPKIIKEEIPLGLATGLRAIVLNTRRPILSPPLRQALDLLFDFEWLNRTLFDGAYARTVSYFGRTDMSAFGRTADAQTRALLAGSGLSQTALREGYIPPRSDGTGRDRRLRRKAQTLLQQAGYRYQSGRLYAPNDKAVALEMIVRNRTDERVALAYKRMLDAAGITLAVRLIDATQYQNRLKDFDFDLTIYNYYASLSPGNEQSYYWSRESAVTAGSRNYAGISNVAMDRAISALTSAKTRPDFARAARAIDRLLMNGGYFVPLYHAPTQWVARWNHIRHNGRHARYGAQIDSWWAK